MVSGVFLCTVLPTAGGRGGGNSPFANWLTLIQRLSLQNWDRSGVSELRFALGATVVDLVLRPEPHFFLLPKQEVPVSTLCYWSWGKVGKRGHTFLVLFFCVCVFFF